MTNVLPPLRDKEYGGAWSIHDPKTMDFLQNIPHKQGNTEQFVNDYADWICENNGTTSAQCIVDVSSELIEECSDICVDGACGGIFCYNNSDCDDTDAAVHPNATEVCDGIDNDCDGQVDEGLTNTFFADTDGDGFGDPNNTTNACTPPNGYVTNNSDCDDNDASSFPGGTLYLGTGQAGMDT